jgi:hypothetical protein
MEIDWDLYRVFDGFLTVETWHTAHPNDLTRFYQALVRIVQSPEYNPDNMGEYFRHEVGAKRDDALGEAVDDYVARAWAVREYLQTVDRESP